MTTTSNPVSVPCPQCGAHSGAPCVSAHGTVYPNYLHHARKLAANAKTTEGDVTITVVFNSPDWMDSVPYQADLSAIMMILTKYGTVYC